MAISNEPPFLRASPFNGNGIPRPSIEMDFEEKDRSCGMFVTPDPEEPAPHHSMSVSIKDASPSVSWLISPKGQDSDEDCVMIDVRECSQKSREKWLSSERKNKSSPEVKIEPRTDRARPEDLVSLQRRLIAHRNATSLHQSGATAIFCQRTRPIDQNLSQNANSDHLEEIDEDQEGQSDIALVNKEFENTVGRNDDDDDDHTWMDLTNDDDGSEEIERLHIQKRAFEARHRLEELSELDKLELTKINQQIEMYGRRAEAMNRNNIIESEDEEEDVQTEHYLRKILYSEAAEDMRKNQEKKQNSRATKKPTKAPKRKVAKSAREVEEVRREKELRKQQKKRARAANSKGGQAKGKGAGNSNERAKSNKNEFRSYMKDGMGSNARAAFGTLLQGLVNNDFVADRQAQKDYGEAPVIREKTKAKALEALLASVPADYDTHKAKTDKKTINEASKRFGYNKVKAADGKWKIIGMNTPLYHHQLIGVDWMLTRELSLNEPYGGLLADAMGLGKTLQMLATMVGNPPSKEQVKAGTKATLIVLPSSVIRQWELEIANHVESKIFPRVFHYKAKKKIPEIFLRDCDIVLTSYAEVMASFPFSAFDDDRCSVSYDGLDKWLEDSKEALGDLHKIHWYRVVLDEAHAIKNYKSRTSLACQALRGTYRWALSGTPLQNSLKELFPYLRFLHAPWTGTYKDFCANFCGSNEDDPDEADPMTRISVILSIVIRRTLKDKILGRPIVELPPINPDVQYIKFSAEERILYQILEERFRDGLNLHFENGTAEKNYAVFLVQLLRLRQCTAHPFLLESTVKEYFNFEDITQFP